jgi:Zn-dependent alcohol dehydrogenases
MMKAVHISGKGKVSLLKKEKPIPQKGEVLLKIRYVGFCGSDLNTFLGNNPMVKLPVIPGHEIGAIVEEVAEGVPDIIKKRDGLHSKSIYPLRVLFFLP